MSELFDFGKEKIGEYEVNVITELHTGIHASTEHWCFQEYHKAFAKFRQLSAIYEWVELRDLNNKYDTLLECGGSNFD